MIEAIMILIALLYIGWIVFAIATAAAAAVILPLCYLLNKALDWLGAD